MKTILNFITILLLPLNIAFALGGNGDADGGGGPSTTLQALKTKGLVGGIYTDFVDALKDNRFNVDLLGEASVFDNNSLDRFQGVTFHPNGSITYSFVKTEKNPNERIEIINAVPVEPDLDMISHMLSYDLGNGSVTPMRDSGNASHVAWITPGFRSNQNWRTNWVTTDNSIGTETESEDHTESSESSDEDGTGEVVDAAVESIKLYQEMVEKYGQAAVFKTFDEVATAVGTQVQTGEKDFYKVDKLESLENFDIDWMINEGPDSIRLDRPEIKFIDHKKLNKPFQVRERIDLQNSHVIRARNNSFMGSIDDRRFNSPGLRNGVHSMMESIDGL